MTTTNQRRSACLAVVLAAFAAPSVHAQQNEVQPSALSINAADCDADSTVTVQWTGVDLNGPYYIGIRLERPVAAGGTTCPNFGTQEPLHVIEPFAEAAVATQNGRLFIERKLKARDLLGDVCDDDDRNAALVCFYGSETTFLPQTVNDIDFMLPTMTITYDTDVPVAPGAPNVRSGDQTLTVVIDTDNSAGDDYTFHIQYRACPSDFVDAGTNDAGTIDADAGVLIVDAESECDATDPYRQVTMGAPPLVVSGLTNGRQYEVRVVVEDDFENVGPPSPSVLATPVDQETPLSVYDGTPNPFSIDGPGCGTSSTMLPFGLGGVLALFRRRAKLRRARTDGGASGETKNAGCPR